MLKTLSSPTTKEGVRNGSKGYGNVLILVHVKCSGALLGTVMK